jgi:hypothetical protein
MTLQEWEEEKDRELDERLMSLLRSDRPVPPAGFVARTMKAVRRAPLPEGRQPLHRPWTVPLGWVALISASAAMAYSVLMNQRVAAELLSSVLAFGVRLGMRLLQSVHTSSMVFDVLVTTGRVAAHAMSTREGSAGLMLMALVAAVSLTMLNRLLVSEKESSSW